MAHRARQDIHRAHLYSDRWLRDKPNSSLYGGLGEMKGAVSTPPRFSSALIQNKSMNLPRPSTSKQASNDPPLNNAAAGLKTPLSASPSEDAIPNKTRHSVPPSRTPFPMDTPPLKPTSISNTDATASTETTTLQSSTPTLAPIREAGTRPMVLGSSTGTAHTAFHSEVLSRSSSYHSHASSGKPPSGAVSNAAAKRPIGIRHLVLQPNRPLLEEQDPRYDGKLVVVLDLDETLAYGRTFGQPKLRPHLHRFLQTLQQLECEVVLWTAGEKGYALAMLDIIDPQGSLFQHCVYRHPRWWSGPKGHIKDLTLLGRPLERTFIVENTPDCVRECEANAILVSDYVGPGTSMLSRAHADHVLEDLTLCVQGMWSDLCTGTVHTVAEALQRSGYLMQRTVGADHTPCAVTTWTLRSDAMLLQCNMPPPSAAVLSDALSVELVPRVQPSAVRQSSAPPDRTQTPMKSGLPSRLFVHTNTSALRSNTMYDTPKTERVTSRWYGQLDAKNKPVERCISIPSTVLSSTPSGLSTLNRRTTGLRTRTLAPSSPSISTMANDFVSVGLNSPSVGRRRAPSV